jgi:hypothetical protein
LQRNVNSGDYANYIRVIGNNGSSDPAAAQLWKESIGDDANNVTVDNQGLWMMGENESDMTIPATLQDRARGLLNSYGIVMPAYSLDLRPGAFSWGNPHMGDVATLIVMAGRLRVNTTVRIVGMTYDVGEDGQEDVKLSVGRSDVTFAALFNKTARDVNALARR